MPNLGKYELATRCAERLLEEWKLESLPVDVMKIAADKGILVEANSSGKPGVSGMLVRSGDGFAIGYTTHIANEGFQRFSVAHELGHYFLPGHPERLFPDGSGSHASRAGFASGDQCELEADHFAAGLLMPRAPFVRAMSKAGEGLSAVQRLAALCRTSLTATAIRYAQCADLPVAVVVSEGSQVSYCFMSECLAEAPGIQWIRKGEAVPRNTATYHLSRDASKVQAAESREESVNLCDWFGSGPDVEMLEEAIGLGSYGKTLTVLTTEADFDEEEDEEEEPRF